MYNFVFAASINNRVSFSFIPRPRYSGITYALAISAAPSGWYFTRLIPTIVPCASASRTFCEITSCPSRSPAAINSLIRGRSASFPYLYVTEVSAFTVLSLKIASGDLPIAYPQGYGHRSQQYGNNICLRKDCYHTIAWIARSLYIQ